MYTTMDKLEEVKIVKGHGDEEIIYKVKNSKEDIFVIIMEYICDFRDTVNCSVYDSLEKAEEEALMFLYFRSQVI